MDVVGSSWSFEVFLKLLMNLLLRKVFVFEKISIDKVFNGRKNCFFFKFLNDRYFFKLSNVRYFFKFSNVRYFFKFPNNRYLISK